MSDDMWELSGSSLESYIDQNVWVNGQQLRASQRTQEPQLEQLHVSQEENRWSGCALDQGLQIPQASLEQTRLVILWI